MRLIAVALFASTLTSCLAYSALKPTPLPEGAVAHQNVKYAPLGADADRRKLDVYLPNGPGPHPVVIFVHGGYWQAGGRNQVFGVYERLGHRLAKHGYAAVIISYRLSPKYKYPVHIEDVSAAIASTLKNLDKLEGDKRRVYLIGHSAGGHLVMTAALEPRWLAVHGVSPSQLAGVVSISGVYDIEDLSRDFFGSVNVPRVFGKNEETWKRASPVNNANARGPKLMLAIGDSDDAKLRRQHAAMVKALEEAGAKPKVIEVSNRTHMTIVTELFDDGDPLGAAIDKFIGPPPQQKPVPSAAR